MEEAENISVDDPSLLHGADDGGKVIVGDYHRSVLFGDLGALDAHGDADIGLLERRGVVHSVARHGDDVPLALKRLDDSQFVLGRDSRKHSGVGDNLLPAGRVLLSQLARMDGSQGTTLKIAIDLQLPCDLGRRRLLIAGDHDRPNACLTARLDGGLGLFAERVAHADQADEDQVSIVILFSVFFG